MRRRRRDAGAVGAVWDAAWLGIDLVMAVAGFVTVADATS
jgi:hypothetical protein